MREAIIENEEELDEDLLELEHRIKNLLWTVSGDYSLDMKVDTSLFLRSKAIALYDGIKQGAFARFFDRNAFSLYLIKKIFLGADEGRLLVLSQMCIEEAIGRKLEEERPGVADMRRQVFADILDQEYEEMPAANDTVGRLRLAVLRAHDRGDEAMEASLKKWADLLFSAAEAEDTMELIVLLDRLYNEAADPDFVKLHGSLGDVLAVTLEDLSEFSWEDFLNEEALESYLEEMAARMTRLEDEGVTRQMERSRGKRRVVQVTPEEAEKAYSYVELNYGRTYLSALQEKQMNARMCRGIHEDCSLYFTKGILQNPVKRNYQYEYAKRLRGRNLFQFHSRHRVIKSNIREMTQTLKKALVLRSQDEEQLSDRGSIVPSRLWRVGRSQEANLFRRIIRGDSTEFAVDILIDASGSQMRRQPDVAIQAYIIAEALCECRIPCRVTSFCTFWDYTILTQFRDYDDPKSENDRIFDYVTSSNNRDGLAIRTVGSELLMREEGKRILIVLSDGRPRDVVLNRPGARCPQAYEGDFAVSDTASQVRRLRAQGISVLGVFVGEEEDLISEKRIFGKDFAYIRTIQGFSRIVGGYLTRLLEQEDL